ncbi:MAG: hypothetical protein ABSG84_12185 [Acidobacteriaceae bacterium]|jgi:hypothetical protein
MQSNTNHRSRQAQLREQKRQDTYRHFYFLTERVIAAYVRISELPLLTAITYDPDLPPQHTLSRSSFDYKLDIEIATSQALSGFPALQNAWLKLAENGKVPAALERSIVTKCGRVYEERGLCPNKYLHSFKRGRVA